MITQPPTSPSNESTPSAKLPRRRSDRGFTPVRAAMLAVAVGVTAFTVHACSQNVTGPASSFAPSSRDGHGELISVEVPLLATTSRKETDDEARANPDNLLATETTFPVTETVTNTCYNMETPVLNGYLKQRERIKIADDLSMKYQFDTWKDTRGVYATATTTWDDDDDPSTAPKVIQVRYRNNEQTIDHFSTGPAGLPFESLQEDRIWLQRFGPEHKGEDEYTYRARPGDDLFVYVKERVRVDNNGATRTERVFRTECR